MKNDLTLKVKNSEGFTHKVNVAGVDQNVSESYPLGNVPANSLVKVTFAKIETLNAEKPEAVNVENSGNESKEDESKEEAKADDEESDKQESLEAEKPVAVNTEKPKDEPKEEKSETPKTETVNTEIPKEKELNKTDAGLPPFSNDVLDGTFDMKKILREKAGMSEEQIEIWRNLGTDKEKFAYLKEIGVMDKIVKAFTDGSEADAINTTGGNTEKIKDEFPRTMSGVYTAVFSNPIRFGTTFTTKFTLDGRPGYCLDPTLYAKGWNPAWNFSNISTWTDYSENNVAFRVVTEAGDSSTYTETKMIMKAFYYLDKDHNNNPYTGGYDPSLMSSTVQGWGADMQFAFRHLLYSYTANLNMNVFEEAPENMKAEVLATYAKLKLKNDVPISNFRIAGDSNSMILKVDGKYIIRSSEFSVIGDKQNTITFTLPDGYTAITPAGRQTGNVSLKGGDNFIIEVPADGSVQGTFSATAKGSVNKSHALMWYPSTNNEQTIAALVVGDGNHESSFTINWKETKGVIKIHKKDRDLHNAGDNIAAAQGGLSFEGVTYAVYNKDGEEVARVTMDKDGKGETGKLLFGDYTLKELNTVTGYHLDDTVYKVSIPDGSDGINATVTTTNQIIRGGVKIEKVFEDAMNIGDLRKLAGVSFKLRHTSGLTEDVDLGPTNSLGYAETTVNALIYGTWKIVEVTTTSLDAFGGDSVSDLFKPFLERTIKVEKEGYVNDGLEIILKNVKNEAIIKMVKTDADTGKVIPIAGAEFKILDVAENKYVTLAGLEVFKTDSTGSLTLPDVITSGKDYRIVEITPPAGYAVNFEGVTFRVTATPPAGSFLDLIMKDRAIEGKINFVKIGEKSEKLEGAEFNVIASEDIRTGDGTLRYAKDTLIEKIVTDKNGAGESTKPLYEGNYHLKEVKAPTGYAFTDKKIDFVIKAKQGENSVTLDLGEIKNLETEIIIKKEAKDNGQPLEGVEFSLYQDGDKIATKKTDKDGNLSFSKLSPGEYSIKETSTIAGYIPSTEERTFTVLPDGNIQVMQNAPAPKVTEVFKNAPTLLEVSKKDVTTGEELEGAKMSLTNKITGKVVETWTSGKTPHIVRALPEGEYILREDLAPLGYAVASEVTIKISLTEEVQKAHMVDKQVFISKKDDKGNHLTGATLAIFDKNGKEVDKWVTDGTKRAANNLVVGETYTLRELSAPKGFLKAKDIEFTVTGDANQEIDMIDELAPSRTPQTGDNSNLTGLFALVMIAGLAAVVFRRKTEK